MEGAEDSGHPEAVEEGGKAQGEDDSQPAEEMAQLGQVDQVRESAGDQHVSVPVSTTCSNPAPALFPQYLQPEMNLTADTAGLSSQAEGPAQAEFDGDLANKVEGEESRGENEAINEEESRNGGEVQAEAPSEGNEETERANHPQDALQAAMESAEVMGKMEDEDQQEQHQLLQQQQQQQQQQQHQGETEAAARGIAIYGGEGMPANYNEQVKAEPV